MLVDRATQAGRRVEPAGAVACDPAVAVNGVQAKVLDEPRSGISPGAWAAAGLLAQAAMAAPARIPAHCARRASGLRFDFNAKNEIIFSPHRLGGPDRGFSKARRVREHPYRFLRSNQARLRIDRCSTLPQSSCRVEIPVPPLQKDGAATKSLPRPWNFECPSTRAISMIDGLGVEHLLEFRLPRLHQLAFVNMLNADAVCLQYGVPLALTVANT